MGDNDVQRGGTMPTGRSGLGVSAVAVSGNVVFSRNQTWAYYQIANNAYDFLSHRDQVEMASTITSAFNSVMADRPDPMFGHIIVASEPFNIDAWYSQMTEERANWDMDDENRFTRFVARQDKMLRSHDYMHKAVYLAFLLGRRGALDLGSLNPLEVGVRETTGQIRHWLGSLLRVPGEDVSQHEEDEAHRVEQELFRTLSRGAMSARRVTSEALLLLIKREMYPGMPPVYLSTDHDTRFGAGDIITETDGVVIEHYHYLEMRQVMDDEIMTGFRATLTFSRFNKEFVFPYAFPFLYVPSRFMFPTTSYVRFTLMPAHKVKKKVETAQKMHKDELKNFDGSQDSYDSALGAMPDNFVESVRDAQDVMQQVDSDKMPWVHGTYRIAVEAATVEQLLDYCSQIRQTFAQINVQVRWTSGDQRDLFLEQMPGDKLREGSFEHVTNLAMLAASGFTFSSAVGDPTFGVD